MYRIQGTMSLPLFQNGGKQIDGCRRVVFNFVGCPGSPNPFPQEQSPLYFNRKEVKEAIHAPVDTECSDVNVFPDGDNSYPLHSRPCQT
ncbi:hypothetical protein BDN67DRAFT_510727 [Paxillus ammoniavirescens]|nr:hypothetical protein BDN67DRAFT_510727 [Paxillus ammoniavirescens]